MGLNKVSIIIPARNEEQFITNTLRSLKNQTYKNHEVIVVINDSSDRTEEIARKYADKVFTLSEKGAGNARNYGAKKANGDIILFIDADTIAPPSWVETYVSLFSKSKYCAIGGKLEPLEKSLTNKIGMAIFNWIVSNMLNYKLLFGGNCGFRKSFLKKVGGFRNRPLLEDIELSLRAQKMGFGDKLFVSKDIKVYTSLRKRYKLSEKLAWARIYLREYAKIKRELNLR